MLGGAAATAVAEPSTVSSATTESTGFLEGAALRTCHRRYNGRHGNYWRGGGWRRGYARRR